MLSFKWTIQIQNGGHIYIFRGQNFLDPVYIYNIYNIYIKYIYIYIYIYIIYI